MKRLKSTLVLLVTSLLLSAQVWAAERTAPTFPEFSTIESGKTYYLYNVGAEKFLTRSTTGTQYPAIGEYNKAVAIDVIARSDGSYSLQFSDNKYYIYATSSLNSRSSLYNDGLFTITGNSDGYTIQRAPANANSYNETEFVGYATDATNDRIVPTLTEGNIIWKFIEKETAEYYIAKRRLYEALLQCDTYFYTIDNFEKVYNDPTSSTELLKEAADNVEGGLLLSSKYVSTEWSDYPIFFENCGYSWNVTGNASSADKDKSIGCTLAISGIRNLKATVKVDEKSTLIYYAKTNTSITNVHGEHPVYLYVYVDGKQVRCLKGYELNSNGYCRYFEELEPGVHEIIWSFDKRVENTFTMAISGIGVEKTPHFEVSLLEPGSLGTEVLYNVDHIKDVRSIKIKGKMNDDDWGKISMMSNLLSIDLSEAEVKTLPSEIFQREATSTCQFLHKVVLPLELETIGASAFSGSYINNIDFPTTLSSIEEFAFASSLLNSKIVIPDNVAIANNAFAASTLNDIYMPDNVKLIGEYCFYNCRLLENVEYPNNIDYIPENCFGYCYFLKNLHLHNGLKTIARNAFFQTYNYNPRIPKTLQSIASSAFSECAVDSLIIPSGCSVYGGDVNATNAPFYNCSDLVYAEFPTNFNLANYYYSQISNCSNLKTLVLKSPTVVGGKYKSNFLDGCPTDVVIKVPSFLVNSYKLDEYWYNYKIEGFNTGDIKDWTLNGNLVMNARERFDGKPNLTINQSGSIKLNGDAVQVFDSLYTTSYNYYSGTSSDAFARILVNNDATSIEGEYKHNYYVKGKYWFFVSLPFDFKVSDVTADTEGTKFVFRYYDGASRAANGASGNWKNYADDAVITAGTGFIVQASADCWLRFTALDNESKQFVVSNEEFVKALAANPSEKASNAGWNLVGNPWQCWYNIHALNFTAPITTYDVYNKKYNAYSIIDDDYAIEPNEAFFVQCPENINSISFPETGRQLTNEIVNQQSAPARKVSAGNRQLVDLLLSCGDANDRTRVVFNDAASMEYETACDASKFFAAEGTCPQLYTIGGEGTEYAINERPYDGGNVQLGVMLANSGKYTFSLPRCDAKEVVLFDNATGVSHNFADGDYTFTAEAGTYTDRFVLGVTKASGTTSVVELESAGITVAAINGGIEVSGAVGKVTILAADGRVVAEFSGERTVPVAPGTYIVRTSAGTVKVVVK